jgi:hypothetical protein
MLHAAPSSAEGVHVPASSAEQVPDAGHSTTESLRSDTPHEPVADEATLPVMHSSVAVLQPIPFAASHWLLSLQLSPACPGTGTTQVESTDEQVRPRLHA